MITQHSFSVIPDGHSLRRRYTVTADAYWDDDRSGQWMWVVRCEAGFVHADGLPYDEPCLFELGEALALAERAAAELKLWTQAGEMTAAEALAVGLR